MARKRSDDSGGYNWMDTYGDMVTLLLTFFILLFSMSSVDEKKWEILVQAFSRNATPPTQQVALSTEDDGDLPSDVYGEYDLMVSEELDLAHDRPVSLSELYDYLKAYVEQNGMDASITVEKDENNNVYLRFDNSIFFGADSSVLYQSSYPLLQFMGECLKGVEDEIFVVRVAGHTAAVDIENYPINDWDLSSSRANRIATYFEESCDFDASKLMTIGYGKNKPRFGNDTAEGRAQNRRVEIMVMGNQFSTDDPDQLYNVLMGLMTGELTAEPTESVGTINQDGGTDVNHPSNSTAPSSATADSLPADAADSTPTDPAANSASAGTPIDPAANSASAGTPADPAANSASAGTPTDPAVNSTAAGTPQSAPTDTTGDTPQSTPVG